MLRQVPLQGSKVMNTAVFLMFSLFRVLQECTEALNALTDVLWIISEAILGALASNSQLSPPYSLRSVQAASCEPLTAGWGVLVINSSTQRAECSATY